MKIKPKIYAEALAELMLDIKAEGPEQSRRVENFLRFLQKNGDARKAKEIIALAENLFAQKTGRRKIVIETARRIKPKQKELVESISQQGDIISEKINEDLIAGIKIIINDEQLDLSMKNKLNKLFA